VVERFSTGNPWERAVGFSRAVKANGFLFVAGTIASDEQGTIHGQTCYEQCCYIFRKIAGVIGSLDRVVKCVAYLTRLEDEPDFTRAHKEFLGAALPATTCVVVQKLFGQGSLVEIELTALA
jgi:enamine deaminase RidA (YjgF/YER057c/UK114 family)